MMTTKKKIQVKQMTRRKERDVPPRETHLLALARRRHEARPISSIFIATTMAWHGMACLNVHPMKRYDIEKFCRCFMSQPECERDNLRAKKTLLITEFRINLPSKLSLFYLMFKNSSSPYVCPPINKNM